MISPKEQLLRLASCFGGYSMLRHEVIGEAIFGLALNGGAIYTCTVLDRARDIARLLGERYEEEDGGLAVFLDIMGKVFEEAEEAEQYHSSLGFRGYWARLYSWAGRAA